MDSSDNALQIEVYLSEEVYEEHINHFMYWNLAKATVREEGESVKDLYKSW